MATSIETSHTYPFPAADVRAALTDPDYVRARLAELGGNRAELVTHEAIKNDAGDSAGGARIVLRQGVPADKLPGAISAMLGGDLVIERTETWQPEGDGAVGTVNAKVPGTPASIKCELTLRANGDGGSQLDTKIQVSVSVPFIGGQVEKAVIEPVQLLLDNENAFTQRWLRERG